MQRCRGLPAISRVPTVAHELTIGPDRLSSVGDVDRSVREKVATERADLIFTHDGRCACGDELGVGVVAGAQRRRVRPSRCLCQSLVAFPNLVSHVLHRRPNYLFLQAPWDTIEVDN